MQTRQRCLLLLAAALATALPAWSASAGSLTVSAETTTLVRDLTAEGSLDWINWNGTPPERKNGGSGQVGTLTTLNPGGGSAYRCSNPQQLTWSDGAGLAINAAGSYSGQCIMGVGNGFSFTVAADATPRTLIVHVGGGNAGALMTVRLSDGSAADYIDSVAPISNAWNRTYTLTYTAAGAGQTLTVTWIQQAANGPGAYASVTAAALRPAGLPFFYMAKVGTAATPVSLAVNGSLVYACDFKEASVVDLAVPTSPVVLGVAPPNNSFVNDGNVFCVMNRNNLAAVSGNPGSTGGSLFMYFDVSNPRSPLFKTSTRIGKTYVQEPVFAGNTAYVPSYAVRIFSGGVIAQYGDLLALDVSSMDRPVLVGTLEKQVDPVWGGAYNVYGVSKVNDQTLYVATTTATGDTAKDGNNGVGQLLVVDASNPAAMSVLKTLSVPGTVHMFKPIVQGNLAVAVGHTVGWQGIYHGGNVVVVTLDISNPRNPVILGTVTTNNVPYSPTPNAMAAIGPNLFMFAAKDTKGNQVLMQVDTASPAAPKITNFLIPYGVARLAVSGDVLAVSPDPNNFVGITTFSLPKPVSGGTPGDGTGTCSFSLSAGSYSAPVTAGQSTVNVTSPAGCGWAAAVQANTYWLRIAGGGSGSGSGTVTFAFDANTGASPRTGTLSIAGQTFTITQAGTSPCTYTLSSASYSAPAAAGQSTVNVTAQSGCSWTAAVQGNATSWLRVATGAGGAGNGVVTFTFDANAGAARSGTILIAGQTFTVSQVSAQITGQAPTLADGGVVNAADYTANLAPGMIVSLFGSNFAGAVSSALSVPLPNSLDGVSVEVLDGSQILNAPLFFVSAGQINAQLPFTIRSSTVDVRVRNAQGVTGVQTITLSPRCPRLFTQTMDGNGAAILAHANYTMVNDAAPALPGEPVILFLTGLGAVSPSIAAGEAGGDGTPGKPLNHVSDAVTVTVDGQPATVYFAGLAPGFAGLYQINFQVPPGGLAGGASISVAVGGQPSQPNVGFSTGIDWRQTSSGTVGSQGGTLTGGQFTLTVPSGTLSTSGTLSIYRAATGATNSNPSRIGDQYSVAGLPATSTGPITVTITVPGAAPDPDKTFIAVEQPGGGEMLVKASVSGNTVTAIIPGWQGAPAAAQSKAPGMRAAEISPQALQLIVFYVMTGIGFYNSEHFEVRFYENAKTGFSSAQALAIVLESDYKWLASNGFDWTKRLSRKPITVDWYVFDDNETAKSAEPWGELRTDLSDWTHPRYMRVNAGRVADPGADRAAHLLFHLLAELYQSAPGDKQGLDWLWLDEAMATWLETINNFQIVRRNALKSPNPFDPGWKIDQAPVLGFATRHGLEYPATSSTAAAVRRHGYGASLFILDLGLREPGLDWASKLYARKSEGVAPLAALKSVFGVQTVRDRWVSFSEGYGEVGLAAAMPVVSEYTRDELIKLVGETVVTLGSPSATTTRTWLAEEFSAQVYRVNLPAGQTWGAGSALKIGVTPSTAVIAAASASNASGLKTAQAGIPLNSSTGSSVWFVVANTGPQVLYSTPYLITLQIQGGGGTVAVDRLPQTTSLTAKVGANLNCSCKPGYCMASNSQSYFKMCGASTLEVTNLINNVSPVRHQLNWDGNTGRFSIQDSQTTAADEQRVDISGQVSQAADGTLLVSGTFTSWTVNKRQQPSYTVKTQFTLKDVPLKTNRKPPDDPFYQFLIGTRDMAGKLTSYSWTLTEGTSTEPLAWATNPDGIESWKDSSNAILVQFQK